MQDNRDKQTTNSDLEKAPQGNQGMLRFFLVAGTIFFVFLVTYEFAIFGSDSFVIYLELCAVVTSWLLNTVLGMDTVVVDAVREVATKILVHEDSEVYVIVARGCDASTVFAVLISTVTAWPSRWPVKTVVVLLGLLLMFGLNILRIAGMLLVEMHMPEQFDLFHEWILPNVLILGALLYFYIWVVLSGTHPAD